MSTSTSNQTRTVLRAEGFSCPSCVTKIEKRLAKMPGVFAAKVHYASARIEVDHGADVTAEDLIAETAKAGYQAKRSAF